MLPRSSGKPMGTPIIEDEDAPAVVNDKDRTMVVVQSAERLKSRR
jgi:hypothetical protein